MDGMTVALFLVGVAAALMLRRTLVVRREGECRSCGYAVGISDRCPECGRAVRDRATATSVRWSALVVALAFVLLTGLTARRVFDHGPVPSWILIRTAPNGDTFTRRLASGSLSPAEWRDYIRSIQSRLDGQSAPDDLNQLDALLSIAIDDVSGRIVQASDFHPMYSGQPPQLTKVLQKLGVRSRDVSDAIGKLTRSGSPDLSHRAALLRITLDDRPAVQSDAVARMFASQSPFSRSLRIDTVMKATDHLMTFSPDHGHGPLVVCRELLKPDAPDLIGGRLICNAAQSLSGEHRAALVDLVSARPETALSDACDIPGLLAEYIHVGQDESRRATALYLWYEHAEKDETCSHLVEWMRRGDSRVVALSAARLLALEGEESKIELIRAAADHATPPYLAKECVRLINKSPMSQVMREEVQELAAEDPETARRLSDLVQ